MKGLMNFLEKAGLVKTDAEAPMAGDGQAPDADPGAASITPPAGESRPATAASPARAAAASAISAPAQDDGMPLNLDDIYASEGVGPSVYPAERLLRLVDGLSAMDEATRQMAIRAMDAADESWSIDDPLADAAAKLKALAAHAERLASRLAQLEQETQAQLDAVNQRQEQAVGTILKQIAELEALAAREQARAAQESEAHGASLKTAQAQTASELAKIMQASERLQGLSAQFGTLASPAPASVQA
ncbi:MAG: putative methyl-accepting chemotaxis sensory transducer [Polaromonas sp.]|nr:putative methyl-accepting chemotaxis sensory transducer [Polaromonas sp.]